METEIKIGTYVEPDNWGTGDCLEAGLEGFCDFYLPTHCGGPIKHTAVNVKITDRMLGLLNELLELDPQAINCLMGGRVGCNEKLAAHKSVQVLQVNSGGEKVDMVGLLGILNGLCGTITTGKRKGWGPITAITDDDDRITEFVRTEE